MTWSSAVMLKGVTTVGADADFDGDVGIFKTISNKKQPEKILKTLTN